MKWDHSFYWLLRKKANDNVILGSDLNTVEAEFIESHKRTESQTKSTESVNRYVVIVIDQTEFQFMFKNKSSISPVYTSDDFIGFKWHKILKLVCWRKNQGQT